MLTSRAVRTARPLIRGARGLQLRAGYRPYTLDSWNPNRGPAGTSEVWPITKMNTVLNIVPQGERQVVERLGKLHAIHDSGFYFAVPFIDHVAYCIDMRERAIDITPQAAITRDNVSVDVSGVVYIIFQDAERACYGAANPLYSVRQHAQSAMRAAIGEMELDEILHNRSAINSLVKGTVQEAATAWGIDIKRYEITEITPDSMISQAMDKQAAAERNRREKVLEAEGAKTAARLESEGVKIKLTNESEGRLIQIQNEAEAEKIKLTLEAEGEAEATMMRARAQAEAIALVGSQMSSPGGPEAANLSLASDYAKMYAEMGSKSNTMMFQSRPADVNALLAQAGMALKVGEGASGGGQGKVAE